MNMRFMFDRHTGGERSLDKINFIVVHDNKNYDETASAWNTARYCSNDPRKAGANYFIDDKETVQGVKEGMIAYAVGDQFKRKAFKKVYRYKHQEGSPYAGLITNTNSISIEMCFGKGRDSTIIVHKTAAAVAYQLRDKGLTFGCVVTHDEASGKNCTGWDVEKKEKFMELVRYYYSKP